MTERRADSELSRRQFLVASAASAALVGSAAAQPSPADTAAPPTPRAGEVLLRITVNGQAVQRAIDPRLSLLDLLREQLDVTSPRRGCGDGTCGSCTVLLDGQRVPSCLVPAALCEGQAITTVEGLATAGVLSPIQAAFVRHGATDCGFCTPGQVVAAQAILRESWGPDDAAVRTALCGHDCACGRLPQIITAIQDVRHR